MDAHSEARVDIAIEILGVPLKSRQNIFHILQLYKTTTSIKPSQRYSELGALVLPLVVIMVCHESGVRASASRFTNGGALTDVGFRLCLDPLIREDPDGDEHISPKRMAKTVQGLIGVVFEEGGLSLAEVAMHNMGIFDREDIPLLKMGCLPPDNLRLTRSSKRKQPNE